MAYLQSPVKTFMCSEKFVYKINIFYKKWREAVKLDTYHFTFVWLNLAEEIKLFQSFVKNFQNCRDKREKLTYICFFTFNCFLLHYFYWGSLPFSKKLRSSSFKKKYWGFPFWNILLPSSAPAGNFNWNWAEISLIPN